MPANPLQKGKWKLTAPSGQEFVSDSPIHCIMSEQATRISEEDRLKNMISAMSRCVLCEEKEKLYTFGNNTVAEIDLCLNCARIIYQDFIKLIGDKE